MGKSKRRKEVKRKENEGDRDGETEKDKEYIGRKKAKIKRK